MKFGLASLALAFLLPQAVMAAGYTSGSDTYWCGQLQQMIPIQQNCPGIPGVTLIGPGKLQRIPGVTSAVCRILTPTHCGVDVLTLNQQYGIGPGFVLDQNCALRCVGYTMVPLDATGVGTFTSGGGTTNNFAPQPLTQVYNTDPQYQHVVGGKGNWKTPKPPGGGRNLRGKSS